MIKIDKKIKYALIILKHFKDKNFEEIISAKGISNEYLISFNMIAKVMQVLAQHNILMAKYGKNGGYSFSPLKPSFNLFQLHEMLIGPVEIVKCLKNGKCDIDKIDRKCNIKNSIVSLNEKFVYILKSIFIKEII